jgi:hypothetical protein
LVALPGRGSQSGRVKGQNISLKPISLMSCTARAVAAVSLPAAAPKSVRDHVHRQVAESRAMSTRPPRPGPPAYAPLQSSAPRSRPPSWA